MDIRDFVKQRVEEGEKQVEIAKKSGVSQGTVYKLLYTDTKPTMDTIIKIANAYHRPLTDFIAAEEGPQWTPGKPQGLTEREIRLLEAFRSLNERRQDRALETIEDMALAFRELRGNEPPAKDSAESSLERKFGG